VTRDACPPSSASSPGSEDSISGSSAPDGAASGRSSSSRSVSGSLPFASLKRRGMETSRPTLLNGEPLTFNTHSMRAADQAPTLLGGDGRGDLRPLTFLSEASPARTSPSPGSGQDSAANAPGSSGRSSASRRSSSRRGDSSRMSQGSFLPIVEETSGLSSEGYGSAGLLSAGGCWTLATSEWLSVAVACSLSAVLQKQVSPRYSLSPRAARGILKRAAKRGRELPPALASALTSLARSEPEATSPTGKTPTPS